MSKYGGALLSIAVAVLMVGWIAQGAGQQSAPAELEQRVVALERAILDLRARVSTLESASVGPKVGTPSPAPNVPPSGTSRRAWLNAATIKWAIGMPAAEVETQIGPPDYASIESHGGSPGGPITVGDVTIQRAAVKEWTARVCRYNCEITGNVIRQQAYFEVTYHQKSDGSWGLNGWEWESEVLP